MNDARRRTAHEPSAEGTPLELCVHACCAELLKTSRASETLYREALSRLGEKGLIALTALVGFCSTVSLTPNAFEIPPVE